MEHANPPSLSCNRSMALLLLASILSISAQPPSQSTKAPSYAFCDPHFPGNYTANSTYESNLRLLLSSLPSSSAPSGFNFSERGSPPNRVYALALCRGDVSSAACRTCLDTATSTYDADSNCPYRRTAVIHYDDCELRYSNQRFFHRVDNTPVCWVNVKNLTSDEIEQFTASVRALLLKLQRYAVHDATSPAMFAAGEIEFEGEHKKIYGTVQCTRDITSSQCDECLHRLLRSSCLTGGRVGARYLMGSCNWRYETYGFFNWSKKLSLPALTAEGPPPSSSPPPVRAPPVDTTETTGNKNTTVIILAVIIPVVVIAFVLILTYCIRLNRRKEAYLKSNGGGTQEISNRESLLFHLDSIKIATNNFSPANVVGEGAFGVVYKGMLSDGKEVAVKRLSAGSNQGVKELKTEVSLLIKLKHRNLVKLVGACQEGREKLLIYEFVANKSLDAYLLNPLKKQELNWETRRKIISGIVRGLLYLHEESQFRIVHRDLKSSNVLLDGDMNPKISDFGLAKLFGEDHSQGFTTKPVGTLGYMPPEYLKWGYYSNKSDVYSFGVLVLEIITGRRNCDLIAGGSYLLSHVWRHWSRGSIAAILDSSLGEDYPQVEALRFLQIGLLCVQEKPKDRPTMSTVMAMLDDESLSIHPPLQPAYFGMLVSEVGQLPVVGSPNSDGTHEAPVLRPSELE